MRAMQAAAKFSLKENEGEARERLRAFWAGSSLGRPALHVTARRAGYKPPAWPGPALDLMAQDRTPAWFAHCAEIQLCGTRFMAEAMPHPQLKFGSHLIVVALLAGAEYRYESNSAWIKPVDDLWNRTLPRFDPAHPVVELLDRHLRAVGEVTGRRGFVNPLVMLDGLTTLSQLRTPARLCTDVLDSPERVQEWSAALTGLYLAAYEHFYRLVEGLGYGESCSWLEAMAEGRMEAVQCDFAVMLSPAMFERFVLPDLRRLTEYLDFSLYHLDGSCQLRFLDLLRTLPRLHGIQWNPEPRAGRPAQWLEAFRDIRRRGFCLHVWVQNAEEAVCLTRALGPDGLLLSLPRFDSEAEAEAAIERIARA